MSKKNIFIDSPSKLKNYLRDYELNHDRFLEGIANDVNLTQDELNFMRLYERYGRRENKIEETVRSLEEKLNIVLGLSIMIAIVATVMLIILIPK